MSNFIYVNLPKGLSESEREEIVEELNTIDGIEDSDVDRAFDPLSITIYIAIGTSVLKLIDSAIPVIQKIKDLFKKRGLKNVDISLPDGTKIAFEEGRADDVEKLATILTKAK
jgi:hypothetical protein